MKLIQSRRAKAATLAALVGLSPIADQAVVHENMGALLRPQYVEELRIDKLPRQSEAEQAREFISTVKDATKAKQETDKKREEATKDLAKPLEHPYSDNSPPPIELIQKELDAVYDDYSLKLQEVRNLNEQAGRIDENLKDIQRAEVRIHEIKSNPNNYPNASIRIEKLENSSRGAHEFFLHEGINPQNAHVTMNTMREQAAIKERKLIPIEERMKTLQDKLIKQKAFTLSHTPSNELIP